MVWKTDVKAKALTVKAKVKDIQHKPESLHRCSDVHFIREYDTPYFKAIPHKNDAANKIADYTGYQLQVVMFLYASMTCDYKAKAKD